MSAYPFQYQTVIKDISSSIANKPNAYRCKTAKQIHPTTITKNKQQSNYNTTNENAYEPNAGHNATINNYIFDPSLTSLKKPEPKDTFDFQSPIIDDEVHAVTNTVRNDNLLEQIDKDVQFLKNENAKYQTQQKLKTMKNTTDKPIYMTEDEIRKEKERLFGEEEKNNEMYLERKRREKQTIDRFIELNDNKIDINDILTNTNTNALSKGFNYEKSIHKSKLSGKPSSTLLHNKQQNKIKRKGYMNHKPIDINDEKFIKKYAKYLLLKKIKDDITGDNEDEYEREYAKFIFTANSDDSPRSLSIDNGTQFKKKLQRVVKSSINNDISSIGNSEMINVQNSYSFIAFIKMIYAMLDKDKKGLIHKEDVLKGMFLDEKIIQDLGFESNEQFITLLDNYEPQNKSDMNMLNEYDFVMFLLSQCDFKDDIQFYLNNIKEGNADGNGACANKKSKKKKHKKHKYANASASDSEFELSDVEPNEDLPGMRTHVYDFLSCGTDKDKLDKLNELLHNTMDYNSRSKQPFKASITKPKKTKIKMKNDKIKISYQEYLTFLRRFHTKDQINFTIPEPFNFLKNDYQQKKIMKMKEILEERVNIEEHYRNHQFHAIKLKEGIWGNRMQNIIEYERQQRQMRQDKLKEKIVAEMKPFSFYDADERKYRERLQQECQPPIFPPFRANAIKWLSQVNIYEDMITRQKKEREERVKERMEKTMKASKLPPRMQMHENQRKLKEEEDKLYNKNKKRNKTQTYRFKANEVPDFAKLQNQFETKLENMKKEAKLEQMKKGVGSAKPFTFHEPKKKIELCKYLDKENNPKCKNPIKTKDINAVIKKMQRKPKIEPSTTKSLNLLIEARRREIEEQQRKRDEIEFDNLLRKDKQDRLKVRVQTSKAIIDNKAQLEENKRKMQEDFRNRLIKNKELYDMELQRRIQKVYNKPLMFEQIGKGDEKYTLGKNMREDLNELLVEKYGEEGDDGENEEEEGEEEEVVNEQGEEGEEGEGEGEEEGEVEGQESEKGVNDDNDNDYRDSKRIHYTEEQAQEEHEHQDKDNEDENENEHGYDDDEEEEEAIQRNMNYSEEDDDRHHHHNHHDHDEQEQEDDVEFPGEIDIDDAEYEGDDYEDDDDDELEQQRVNQTL